MEHYSAALQADPCHVPTLCNRSLAALKLGKHGRVFPPPVWPCCRALYPLLPLPYESSFCAALQASLKRLWEMQRQPWRLCS